MGGGAYLKGGCLLQILSLRKGTKSKQGAYFKLGSISSIFGMLEPLAKNLHMRVISETFCRFLVPSCSLLKKGFPQTVC